MNNPYDPSKPNEGTSTELFALQSVSASNAAIEGPVIDVVGIWMIAFFIKFGRQATASGVAPVNFRVFVSDKTSGDDSWCLHTTVPTQFAAVESEAATGTNNAGQKVITMASTTNLATDKYVFILNTTFANSEFGRIAQVSANTSITLLRNLVNAQNSGAATVYADAEEILIDIDVSKYKRVQVVAFGMSFTQAWAMKGSYITLASLS